MNFNYRGIVYLYINICICLPEARDGHAFPHLRKALQSGFAMQTLNKRFEIFVVTNINCPSCLCITLCLCVCVCVCACVTLVCVCVLLCVCVCVCVCVLLCVCTCYSVCVCGCVCALLCVCVSVCLSVCPPILTRLFQLRGVCPIHSGVKGHTMGPFTLQPGPGLRSGELRMQKFKSLLSRTQSLQVLP